MTQKISVFSDTEIITAALSVAASTRIFKTRDVRRLLMSYAGHLSTDFWKKDQRFSKITGAKVSATLRAHPDLFTANFSQTGRVRSFCRVGEA